MGCWEGRGRGRRFAGLAVLSGFREGAGMMDVMFGKESEEDELSVWRVVRWRLLGVVEFEFVSARKEMKNGVGSPALLEEMMLSVVLPRKKSSANDGGAGDGTNVTICRALRRRLRMNCPADTAFPPTERVPRFGLPVTFLKVSLAELLLSH